ncbi:MAG: RluA family pseudouridine synthase [Pseudomonadota bacterium]
MIREAHAQIPADLDGERLDRAMAALLGISRGQARRVLDLGGAYLAGQRLRTASRPVKAGERVQAFWADPAEPEVPPLSESAVLLRRKGLLAVDKPAGVHCQAARHTLVGTLPDLCQQLLGLRTPPEPMHRLDRDCSGVVVLAEHAQARSGLGQLMARGRARKRYLAVVAGEPAEDAMRIAAPIAEDSAGPAGRRCVAEGGQEARTLLRVLVRGAGASLVELEPLTGRTHQLRVHCAHMGLSMLGDPWYAPPEVRGRAPRLCLHAWRLELPRGAPGTPCEVEAPLPEAFMTVMAACGIAGSWGGGAG